MLISKLVFKFLYPKNIKELALFILLAAPIGYVADLIIYYFPSICFCFLKVFLKTKFIVRLYPSSQREKFSQASISSDSPQNDSTKAL